MKTCEYAGDPFVEARSHPWIDSASDTDCRYYDLTVSPAHIRSSLEDLRPWDRYEAIQDFYVMLEWLNHPGSVLESNDCAFTGPQVTDDSAAPKAFECSGRVMVLFRALEKNTAEASVDGLKHQLHVALENLDRKFRDGVIGTTIVPVRYLSLPESNNQQIGSQLMISFWAWGDSEAETMASLARLLKNLSRALRVVSAQVAGC